MGILEAGTNIADRINISNFPTAMLELNVTEHWNMANSA